jgi:hypothetical protein
VSPEGELRNAYDVFDPTSGQLHVDQDDMLHFSGFGFDGLRSISVVQHAARNAIGNALAASDYMGKQRGRGRHAEDRADLSEQAEARSGRAAAQELRRDLREWGRAKDAAGADRGRHGDAADDLAVDLQLLEPRRFEREDICQAFGVPPVLIGDQREDDQLGHRRRADHARLREVHAQAAPGALVRGDEPQALPARRPFVEFDLDALLAGDSKAQAEAFRFALGGPGTGDGWMSVNEVRRLKNQPPSGPSTTSLSAPSAAPRNPTRPRRPRHEHEQAAAAAARQRNARAPKGSPRPVETTDTEAHVYVYDVIDAWWGASARR